MQDKGYNLQKITSLALCLCFFAYLLPGQTAGRYTGYVDTRIGTAPAATTSALQHSEAGSELKGQTIPAVGPPHAMTQWTPQTQATEKKCIAPYYYNDREINGFRGTHWLNGSCVQDYGSFTVMPVSGTLTTDLAGRASAYSHDTEVALPDYYAVFLDKHRIQAELTGSPRGGMMRFSFKNDEEQFVLIEANSDEGEGFVTFDPEKNEVRGYNPVHRIYQGIGQPAGFSGHFVIRFNKPVKQYGSWSREVLSPRQTEAKGAGSGIYLGWGAEAGEITLKIGTSFTGTDQARLNLDEEIREKTFETLRSETRQSWEDALGKVKVTTRNEADKTLFYTAVYRTKLSPRLFSDADGSYPSFAGGKSIMKAEGFNYYCDFSLWDTFRAAMPLHLLLEPQQAGDLMQSLVKKAEQGGWMPIFPLWNHYTAAMIGDHVASVVADAYVKGIENFDVRRAYRYLRKNAFDPNKDRKSYEDGQGRRALESYLKYGYIPMEDSVWQAFHKREQVSRTLEYAYDDYCLSVLAKKLGYLNDAAALRQRALYYRHVIDPVTGYARGRYSNGSWVENFDPFAKRATFITEGSPAQYTWFIPQDVGGLARLMGGPEAFNAKLDTLFDQGHYWHGNEPNHQIAYLYGYTGEPWKTQRLVHRIVREEYGTGPGGLSGNEDGGQMSAWLAFSMIGMYPVCPGTPYYILGSPSFEETSVAVKHGKSFVVKANKLTRENIFIQSARLNGKPFDQTWISHETLLAGGILELEMGAAPSRWGSQVSLRPPSLWIP